MKITKLKFGKRTVVVEGETTVTEAKTKKGDTPRTFTKTFSETYSAPPTESFKGAVEKLKDVVYVYVPIRKEKLDSFAIGSVSLTQEEDGVGLVISAKTIMNNDLPWNFNTPFLSSELLDAGIQDTIDLIVEEARKYTEGNFGVQAEISFGEEEESEQSEKEKDKMSVAA